MFLIVTIVFGTRSNASASLFSLQAYEWELHLAKARADKHDEIFQAVLRVRREAQERYNDPDGLTVKQRQKIDEKEKMEQEKIERETARLLELERECKNMDAEDRLSWDIMEREREMALDRLRRVALAKEERQQEQKHVHEQH